MMIIVIVAAVLMVAATAWWLGELRKGRVIESPDPTVKDAQHGEG